MTTFKKITYITKSIKDKLYHPSFITSHFHNSLIPFSTFILIGKNYPKDFLKKETI